MINVTFRADDQTETDLQILQEAWGGSRTDAIRQAVHRAAEIALAEQVLARSRELAEDPEDRRAVAEALADMEDLRAW
jgi:predicted transcriptional regulator